MKRTETLHPVNLLIYFVGVLVLTMFTMNPVLVCISFLGAICFFGTLNGFLKLAKSLLCALPIFLVLAATNPIFVHDGETVLFFLNDNPFTLEALLYGGFFSLMLIAVYYWFASMNRLMTSDVTVYLFGRIIPKLSLVFSMAVGFVPRFKRYYREINSAQKTMGYYSGKSYSDRIKNKFRVFSALVTVSLESSVDTADNMRAKGYGLKGRTSYSIFRWGAGDGTVLALTLALAVFSFVCIATGVSVFEYYPRMSGINLSPVSTVMYIAVAALMFLFTALEVKETMLWRYLRSKI